MVDVDVVKNLYTIAFPDPMPKPPSDFSTSVQGNTPLEVKIRRKSHNTQFDLLIRTAPALIEHWSSANVSQPAQKSIGGLGEALTIARNREGLIGPEDLTPDFDSVVQTVRNNLIHLSGDALSTPLPEFASLTVDRHFTLQDFLQADDLVYDLVTNVADFVNGQYVKLRQSGHFAS